MITVDTYNQIEGFHRYPDAPEFCQYLSHRHRHIFVIRCNFEVTHNEREIEINYMQNKISALLEQNFGTPCEFASMSCEAIAEFIIKKTNAKCVQVLEDNYGGATLSR